MGEKLEKTSSLLEEASLNNGNWRRWALYF
jgi:hypothetical protein